VIIIVRLLSRKRTLCLLWPILRAYFSLRTKFS
jgi:hypothetical protein